MFIPNGNNRNSENNYHDFVLLGVLFDKEINVVRVTY